MSRDYKKLKVFEKADQFARQVYKVTQSFPKSEQFGLTSQLRRAALSIPLNIVEGCSRDSERDFARFLEISIGSAFECDYVLSFALEQKYLTETRCRDLIKMNENTIKMLQVFRSKVKSRLIPNP